MGGVETQESQVYCRRWGISKQGNSNDSGLEEEARVDIQAYDVGRCISEGSQRRGTSWGIVDGQAAVLGGLEFQSVDNGDARLLDSDS